MKTVLKGKTTTTTTTKKTFALIINILHSFKDLLNEGYEAPALTVKYFCDDFPAEKKIDVKIIDVGAGTGLVARGVRNYPYQSFRFGLIYHN